MKQTFPENIPAILRPRKPSRYADSRHDFVSGRDPEHFNRTWDDKKIYRKEAYDARFRFMTLNDFTIEESILPDTSWLDSSFRGLMLDMSNLRSNLFKDCTMDTVNIHLCNLQGVHFDFCQIENMNILNSDMRYTSWNNTRFEAIHTHNVQGLIVLSGAGSEGRTYLVVDHYPYIMVKAGCYWGTAQHLLEKSYSEHPDAIHQTYIDGLEYARKCFNVQRSKYGARNGGDHRQFEFSFLDWEFDPLDDTDPASWYLNRDRSSHGLVIPDGAPF